MRYRIWDLQCSRHFGDGLVFKSKEECRRGLLDFHQIDWDEKAVRKHNMKMTLEEVLDYGLWQLETYKLCKACGKNTWQDDDNGCLKCKGLL